MRIIHVIFSLNIGGSETMLVDLINEQIQTNTIDLIVINDSYNKSLIQTIDNTVTIHYLNRLPGSFNLLSLIKFNHLIFRLRPAVIHFHNHNAIKMLIVRANGAKCLTVHSINIPVSNLHRYTRVFSISNSVGLDILNRSGINPIRIYNGINFDKVQKKKRYDFNGNFRIVQVSRLDHHIKGQHILLKAVNQLVYKFGLLNLKVDLIGEGPSLQFLKNLVEQYQLTPFINFLGARDRNFVYTCLSEYDLLIQPSIHEGFGLTIVEGIAAGLPVITSNVDGPAEIAKSIPNSWVFPYSQSLMLAKSVMTVFNLYKSAAIEHKCKMNYSAASQRFSIKQMSRKYLEYYV